MTRKDNEVKKITRLQYGDDNSHPCICCLITWIEMRMIRTFDAGILIRRALTFCTALEITALITTPVSYDLMRGQYGAENKDGTTQNQKCHGQYGGP